MEKQQKLVVINWYSEEENVPGEKKKRSKNTVLHGAWVYCISLIIFDGEKKDRSL